nr:hypothetical protein GTC16762_26010 [Pigmentibacter ruber]
MPLRSSRLSKWSIYIILSSIFLAISVLIFLIIIYFYPIPAVTNNFQHAQFSRFISPWPMSALDQELIERRRLKRYAKGEQLRRMEKQLQRMELLNIPIYDLFLDANAEVYIPRFVNSQDISSFLWPILPGRKIFSNSNNSNFYRKSSNIIFPYNHWAQLSEGIILQGGEEVKATIPLVKGRRAFAFNLFLLSPGSIRINLGQYVWSKSFTDDDVQKKLHFSIPINDSTATSIKVASISSSFYLLNANVNHIEHTGRSSIHISATSNFWTANKDYLISNQKSVEENDIETNDQEDLEEEKLLEEGKPEEAKFDELVTNQKPFNGLKKDPKKNDQTIQDPLNQIANQQIITNDLYTTAFGYNIVFLQLPKLSDNILQNKKLLSKSAPNLFKLMEQSVIFNNSIEISENVSENFRKFIYSNTPQLNSENLPIIKEEINENKNNNTYYLLRKYGYNIVGISYPESYFYSRGISETSDFSSLYGKWLEKNDWNFASKNIKIDDRNLPVTGLDAIFKTGSKGISPPLNSKDFSIISNYLAQTSKNIGNIPDWGANEYILVNNKDLYVPRVVEAFQNWSKENQQSRFLSHILLDSELNIFHPSIKELGKAIATLGFSSILSPFEVNNVANITFIDKAVGQILDTIKARKIENRTIIFALIPSDKNGKSHSATGVFKIPGLVPKKNIEFNKINIEDIVLNILTNVGIPLEKTNTNILENLKNEEYISYKEKKNKILNNYMKYTLVIKPDENNCSSFIWNSQQEQITNIQSNYPIHQLLSDNQLEIFPCAIKGKYIYLNWFQRQNISQNSNSYLDNYLGGFFQYKKDGILLPNFYFGKRLIPFDNIAFYFDSLKKEEIESIFTIEEKYLKKGIKNFHDNFQASDVFESKNVDEQELSKKTKIGFSITPL